MPEIIDKHFLNLQVMIDLKILCNHVVSLRSQKKSNLHILNFRRSVISCLVSSFNFNQLRKSGQKFDKKLFKSCKRKRDDGEEFLNLDPSSNAGRKAIGEDLKEEIERLWHNNSRVAAQCLVTNPENRTQRRPGRRLTKPPRQIIIASEIYIYIYIQGRASYWTIWGYRPC